MEAMKKVAATGIIGQESACLAQFLRDKRNTACGVRRCNRQGFPF